MLLFLVSHTMVDWLSQAIFFAYRGSDDLHQVAVSRKAAEVHDLRQVCPWMETNEHVFMMRICMDEVVRGSKLFCLLSSSKIVTAKERAIDSLRETLKSSRRVLEVCQGGSILNMESREVLFSSQ